VSVNGGHFHNADPQHEGWFRYPAERPAINIPLMATPDAFLKRARAYLPVIVAVLAAGRTVGVHCLNAVHRSPLGLAMLALALLPRGHFESAAAARAGMLQVSERCRGLQSGFLLFLLVGGHGPVIPPPPQLR
jgi:hypothetical protein